MGSWESLSSLLKKHHADENLSDETQAETFTDEVLKFIHLFCHVRLPSSPLDSVPEVIAIGSQMKQTINVNKITDFPGFKHFWKHLGK